MGIELFFKSISENTVIGGKTGITFPLFKQKLECSHLFVDFNSIIHVTSSKILGHMNKILYYSIMDKSNPNLLPLAQIYGLEALVTDDSSKIRSHVVSNIDNYIIDAVQLYVLDLITNFTYADRVKLLYLAIDGVPMKAKMIEQRKRRYMGTLTMHTKNKMYKKYIKLIKQDKRRYAFEESKIEWSKNLITPGTYFMDKMIARLRSEEFKQALYERSHNTMLIVSDIWEYGEGEKKIVDYIFYMKRHPDDRLVIYSPDADMTILSLILYDFNINILRYNQQKSSYDVIEINKLKKNLIAYINNKLRIESGNHMRIMNDISFIFTMFGNDFVPKIESINVKNDFNYIIDRYISFFKDNSYILDVDRINYTNFVRFVKLLARDEISQLQKNYMSKTYRNYNKVADVFDPDGIHDFNYIVEQVNDYSRRYSRLQKDMYDKGRVSEDMKNDNDLWLKLNKLTLWKNKAFYDVSNPRQIAYSFENEFKKTGKLPRTQLYLQTFGRNIHDHHHQKRFQENIGGMQYTEYDVEVYQFENLLEPYYTVLGVESVPIGRVTVDGIYWKQEDQDPLLDGYNRHNFNSLDGAIDEYMTGLMWVFDYYYHNSPSVETMNSWYYTRTKAPLLLDIARYLDNKEEDYFNSLLDKIRGFDVPLDGYYDPYKQLLFVTPLTTENQDILPKNIAKYSIAEADNLLDRLASYIVDKDTDKVAKYIDCKGALFLSKCHIIIN